jgi:hypothetical protein
MSSEKMVRLRVPSKATYIEVVFRNEQGLAVHGWHARSSKTVSVTELEPAPPIDFIGFSHWVADFARKHNIWGQGVGHVLEEKK